VPHFDIFNGDADGIFALHQMRMETPQSSAVLITGVKRDITLLSHVADRKDSSISVFDISLDSNRQYLDTLLSNNNSIEYFDHHFAGTIPDSPLLQYEINVSPESCTSLIVNNILNGKNFRWAICGAFGDNLHRQAEQLANDYSLTEKQTLQLREIGELFNYNGYGSTLSDLHFHPENCTDRSITLRILSILLSLLPSLKRCEKDLIAILGKPSIKKSIQSRERTQSIIFQMLPGLAESKAFSRT